MFSSLGDVSSAQANCRTIDVVSVRAARVELYDLNGHYQSIVPREDLGHITQATECGDGAVFLAINTPQGTKLVRRIALELRSAIVLPPCPCGVYAQNDARNASSSGLGGAQCVRQACPGDH